MLAHQARQFTYGMLLCDLLSLIFRNLPLLCFFSLVPGNRFKALLPLTQVFQVSSHSRNVCDRGYFKSRRARQGNLESSQFPDECLPRVGVAHLEERDLFFFL